ncbi:glutathione S-transferase family protein [Halomonas binhaiensis]|nr:glutathione S-transferase family protein [Halomonas binhaiensis]
MGQDATMYQRAALTVYLHPFSSYCQKAKVAFYEKGVPFVVKLLDGSEPVASEFAALWPIGKFPVAVDGDQLIFEATGIIEYLEALYPDQVRLIPQNPVMAAEVRMWDRFFDNYISYPQQRVIYVALGREPDDGDDCAKWKTALETAYAILDQRMAGREWVAGNTFSLADCAAAPALLYADWTHAIPERFSHVHAYRTRLLARSSYAQVLDEARPYRHLFPLGAPQGRD